MSNIRYNADDLHIELEGLENVAYALGNLAKKTPAVAKVAINATAREARKLMIAEAKARYAVNVAGQKHLKDLVQRKKASNTNLSAELYISTFRNDLGYFHTQPRKPYMGMDVYKAPEYFKGHVLKSSSLTMLAGTGNLSKGFLLKFKSGHIGMVQRVIGSRSRHTETMNGKPRWRNAAGDVEKVQTMGSPSATAMHNTVWTIVEPDVEEYLQMRLQQQVSKVITRTSRK